MLQQQTILIMVFLLVTSCDETTHNPLVGVWAEAAGNDRETYPNSCYFDNPDGGYDAKLEFNLYNRYRWDYWIGGLDGGNGGYHSGRYELLSDSTIAFIQEESEFASEPRKLAVVTKVYHLDGNKMIIHRLSAWCETYWTRK